MSHSKNEVGISDHPIFGRFSKHSIRQLRAAPVSDQAKAFMLAFMEIDRLWNTKAEAERYFKACGFIINGDSIDDLIQTLNTVVKKHIPSEYLRGCHKQGRFDVAGNFGIVVETYHYKYQSIVKFIHATGKVHLTCYDCLEVIEAFISWCDRSMLAAKGYNFIQCACGAPWQDAFEQPHCHVCQAENQNISKHHSINMFI